MKAPDARSCRQLPEWLSLCASSKSASLRRSFSSDCLRASISVSRLYQRTMRPSASRSGRPRDWNQRYSPSARRMRCSNSYGWPVWTACCQAAVTRGRSAGCTASVVPHCLSSSSVRPKYSRTWRLTCSTPPSAVMTAMRPGMVSTMRRKLSSLEARSLLGLRPRFGLG